MKRLRHIPLFLFAWACTSAALVPQKFHISSQEFSVRLPPKVRVLQGDDATVVFDFGPAVPRKVHRIVLKASAASDGKIRFPSTKRLENGAVLRFEAETTEGGSGGGEYELKGVLELSGHVLYVECRNQGEYGVTLEWCLPYLGEIGLEP